jgi:putative acetyltransferase
MHIRPERPDDIDAIHRVVRTAFLGAAHTSGTEHLIVQELRRARALTLSLVAVLDGQIIGHVAISPVAISDGSPGWYGLGPVSVAPSHQNRGVGYGLVSEALSRIKHEGAAGCVVLGEPAYYGRFGFHVAPALVLEGVPPGYFQALALAGSAARGTVTYHPAFGS